MMPPSMPTESLQKCPPSHRMVRLQTGFKVEYIEKWLQMTTVGCQTGFKVEYIEKWLQVTTAGCQSVMSPPSLKGAAAWIRSNLQ